jgi:hypothetical protein
MDTLGTNAEQIDIAGLQIINGAQTVYSIFNAYKNLSLAGRKRMNNDMLITLRLIRSAGDTFNMDVTRFTNSRNPLSGRDFCANDEIQIALQNAFFDTKIWYEKREGEFRETPENITIVPNSLFAKAYLTFVLQDPVSLLKQEKNQDLLFLTKKEHPNGLYDTIFQPNIKAEALLAAYYMTTIAFSEQKDIFANNNDFRKDIYYVLALSYTWVKNYFTLKFGDKVSVFKKIIELYEKGQTDILYKALEVSLHFWIESTKDESLENKYESFTPFTPLQHFFMLRSKFEIVKIDVNDLPI